MSLIDELSDQCKPVAPTTSKSLWLWSLAVFLMVTVSVSAIGIRHDYSEASQDIWFWLQAASLIVMAVSSVSAAYILSVPGGERHPILTKLLTGPLVLWLLVMMGTFTQRIEPFLWNAYSCAAELFAIGIIPALLLILIIRKAASTAPMKTGMTSMLAAFATGAIATQFTCSLSDPMHLLVFHFVPIFVLALIGSLVGRRVLVW